MVLWLRFGCGESAPSKTSKASTQPGYGTRFIAASQVPHAGAMMDISSNILS